MVRIKKEVVKLQMKVGLIGCGRVAHLHMLSYKYINNIEVVAVSDIDLNRAKSFAKRYGVKRIFRDFKDLLEIKEIDFVDVCTPVSTHSNIVCEVAKYGHNILVEKPMARRVSECDKMIHEVSKRGVKLCICHNQLYLPSVMEVKNITRYKKFKIIFFRSSIKESAEIIGAPLWVLASKEGGILWETGCHAAYLQLHFLGDISEVFAIGNKVKHLVHDRFSVLLRTPTETYGIIEISWLAREREIVYEFESSDGRRIKIWNYSHLLEESQKVPNSLIKAFWREEKRILKKWFKVALDNIRKGELLRCISHFNLITKYVQSLKFDLQPPVSAQEGRKTIKLLECIEESLNKNRPVKFF
jgi:predicted dehydrogenase